MEIPNDNNMSIPENQVRMKVKLMMKEDKDKKKDESFQDKDKIEQAASIIQGMLINSEFVRFTKSENLDKKGDKATYDMNIVNNEVLRKLDNKEQLKLAELNKLKKVYYQPEDYEFESALRDINEEIKNPKERFSTNDIIYGIVMLRREQLRKEIEDKSKVEKVKEEIFINLDDVNNNIDPENQGFGEIFDGNEIKEVEKPEIVKRENVNEVIKVLQDNSKSFKKEMDSARKCHPGLFNQIETNFEKFSKKKYKEKQKFLEKLKKESKIEEGKNEGEEKKDDKEVVNNKQKVSSEINKIKKEKLETNKEFFNGTAETRFELARNINNMVSKVGRNNSSGNGYWADIIRSVENDPNKKGIPQNEQNLYCMLDKIQKGISDYTDIAGPLTEAFNLYKNEASKKDYAGTDLYKLNMLNVVVALLNKVNELTNIVNTMWQYNVNEYKNNKQVAILGNKGVEMNKSAILFTEKKNITNSNNFIPQEQWEQLPLEKRILRRFKFSDYNQLPNAKTWNSFNKDEKCEFINSSIKFRINRSRELLREYEENKEKGEWMRTVAKINAFLYYNCKDSKGFNCMIEGEIWKDLNEWFNQNKKDYDEHKERIKNLEEILKKHSDDNNVIGIYFVKGKKIKCNGKSYQDTIIAKTKYKSNNKKYNSSGNGYKKKYNKDNTNRNKKQYNNKSHRNNKYYRKNNNNKDRDNYKKKYDELLNKIKQNKDSNSILSDLEKEKKEREQKTKPDF